MLLKDKIIIFSALGRYILDEKNTEQISDLVLKAKNQNAWFTEDNIRLSLKNIAIFFLEEKILTAFTAKYHIPEDTTPKKVGVVMAGNIPAVGFHDLLCVVLSGHIAEIKLSSSDAVIIAFLIQQLIRINKAIEPYLQIVERLNHVDALIATGSDNTAKHFAYYFADKPHIIRHNRTSVAVFNGNEQKLDLMQLGDDIFQYFGLGCRNVSKFYVPVGYKFDNFYEAIEHWNTILLHHKYQNNYDYNKSIYLINKNNFYDNGFLLLNESEGLVSPISVVFFEFYDDLIDLNTKINQNKAKIQCVLSQTAWYSDSLAFGQAQMPNINDFADNVDTMAFLLALK